MYGMVVWMVVELFELFIITVFPDNYLCPSGSAQLTLLPLFMYNTLFVQLKVFLISVCSFNTV